MLTGKMISEALAVDSEVMGGMTEDQSAILREYAENRLPQALAEYLLLPATYANTCRTIAACLKDMVKEGVIGRLLLRAPCCSGHCGCAGEGGISPDFVRSFNAIYLSIAADFETQAATEPVNQETALWQLGVDPEHLDRIARCEMTVGDLLAVQPFLFMHHHRH